MRWVGRGLLLAALTALTGELLLQSFALVIDDRSDNPLERHYHGDDHAKRRYHSGPLISD